MLKQRLSKLLIYSSLLFLIFFLWKKDLFELDFSPLFRYEFLISIIVLCVGFVLQALAWHEIMRVYGVQKDRKTAICAQGKFIFTKYIPGKVWTVLGRASVYAKSKEELKKYSFYSFQEQVVYLWTGFLVSLGFVCVFVNDWRYQSIAALAVLFGAIALFNSSFNSLVKKLFVRIFRREINLPYLKLSKSWRLLIAEILLWGVWSISFYIFASLFSEDIVWYSLFIFPVSVCIGVLAIIFPGGIGAREAIMVLLLTQINVEIEIASSIAIFSRVWFLVGESFIFLISQMIKLKARFI